VFQILSARCIAVGRRAAVDLSALRRAAPMLRAGADTGRGIDVPSQPSESVLGGERVPVETTLRRFGCAPVGGADGVEYAE
jgi:hypothetical protein